MENAGWTLEKCKEYEKEQIDKCFPETEMPGNDAAFDHSECRNPEELSKKIVRFTNIDRMARLRLNSQIIEIFEKLKYFLTILLIVKNDAYRPILSA